MLCKKCARGTLRAQSWAPAPVRGRKQAGEKEREEGKLEQRDEGMKLWSLRPEVSQGQWQRALCAKLRGLHLFPTSDGEPSRAPLIITMMTTSCLLHARLYSKSFTNFDSFNPGTQEVACRWLR